MTRLKPADIDHIIELIEQITDALTKSDFLSLQEQQLLDQYEQYEHYAREIRKMKRALLMPGPSGGEVKCTKLIKHYKEKQGKIKTEYDSNNASILKRKLLKAQTEHIRSVVPPLQKDLDLYLVPRWPEILALSTQGQLKQEIEGHFLKGTTAPAKNNILITVKTKLVDELQRIKAKLEYKQAQLPAATTTDQNTTPAKMKYDVFICHASEDKKEFVKPLADALIKEKLRVWYDEFELTLGDSLREKIDYGLANSEYGVVVLSEAFFRKKWPQDELDGLVARQNSEGKKVILPIWHKVSYDEVKRFSPTLAGKFAAKSEKGIKQVVDDILKVINYSGHTISTSDLVNKSVNQQYDQIVHEQAEEESVSEKPAETEQNTTTAKDLSKEPDKAEAGTQAYPGPRRQVPTSDADRQRAFLGGYTVGEYKYAPDLPRGETATKQNIAPAKRQRIKRITGWIFKIPHLIYILVIFFAALLTCLYLLGWLEQIKAFIYNILQLE